MKYITIIFLCFSLLSCIRNNSTEQNNEAKYLTYGYRNQGIYFPEYFIETLLETRSYMRAFNIFSRIPNNDLNIAITISEDHVMFIYSFHEGIAGNIIEYNARKIILGGVSDPNSRVYIIDDYTIKNQNGIIFTNVSRNFNNATAEYRAFVTNIIFGNNIYRNEAGDEIFRLENGNVSVRNIEYELVLNTVWYHPEYDVLLNRATWDYIFFRVYNDAINIYELAVIGEEGPMWARLGEYRLIDVFR